MDLKPVLLQCLHVPWKYTHQKQGRTSNKIYFNTLMQPKLVLNTVCSNMAANFINYTLLINRSYLLCEERCLIVGNLQERLKYRSRSFTGTLSLWWRRCANYENHFTFQAPLSSRKFLKVVAKESRGSIMLKS